MINIRMKVADLFEAKYQDSNEKKLDGWFIAGNRNDKITITIGDFKDVGRGKMHAKIVDWESSGAHGGLAYYYKDGLEPGTEVEFSESRTTLGVPERAWYIMPMSDNPATGWFIRGPNLPGLSEAKYHGVDDMVECPRCKGKGWEYSVIDLYDVEKDTCMMCSGEGKVTQDKVNKLTKRQHNAKRLYF